MARFVVAARRTQLSTGQPLPAWHAFALGDDEDPAARAGERVMSLCGVPGLRLFPVPWEGLIAANGCPVCRVRAVGG